MFEAARAPTSVAMAVFTLAVRAASSVNSPALRLVSGEDAQPATPRAAASAMLTAVMTLLMLCSFSVGSSGYPPRSASAPASAPPAAGRAHGRPAASDRRASAEAPSALRLPVFPFAHLLFGIVLRAAVAFLDLADQLVAMAGELVVREFAPALLERAFHLLPVTGDAIPIHV